MDSRCHIICAKSIHFIQCETGDFLNRRAQIIITISTQVPTIGDIRGVIDDEL
ncbi:Uncharacterised protein [uncultured archaeon]|nr:Uncharacterised protein [uncultured archaeon]